MGRLVVVVPLREGSRARAEELLADGPPLDLSATRFDRHSVFLSDREAIFVFEREGSGADTLDLPAEDPSLWRAAAAWREVLAGRPRLAKTAFSWERGG